MFELLLALALVTAEPDNEPSGHNTPLMREVVRGLAVHMELLDARETTYYFVRESEWDNDLLIMRRRHAELKGVPPISDSVRFPSRDYIAALLTDNRTYSRILEGRRDGEPGRYEEIMAVTRENDKLYKVWDAVRDAKCEYYYVSVRRTALKRCMELIGEEAYYAGRLPPHVPVWRFQRVP